MTKNEFKLLYTLKKYGVLTQRDLSKLSQLSLGYVSKTLKIFMEKSLITEEGLTEKGLKVLEKFRVRNAVIMAAGMSSRFVPISLEKPKGLLTVKNEVLIERQIEQLMAAGINEIVIVVGYKKEAFFYLETKYPVKLIINPNYNTKNNIETLRLVANYLGNTYICSSDNYFSTNVFEPYVYQSYYSSVFVTEKSSEWYMIPDKKGNVSKVIKSGTKGHIMLGHVYWDNTFASEFVKLINRHSEIGDYDAFLWEQLFSDYCKKLPPMEIKTYPKDVIFEFDSLEELREFDRDYVKNTRSSIMNNICSVLRCNEEDIVGFKPIKEGLTNTSFIFEVKGEKYVYRHPGEGTDAIISRKNEKAALELAKLIDIDPTYLFMDDKEGWKISKFVSNFRIPDYNNFEDSKMVADTLRKLHEKKLHVDWSFTPWEDALKLERLIREKNDILMSDFDELKELIQKCYERTIGDGVEKVFCHCDTYAPNWMLTEDKAILIDWEYAGNADPGNDIGAYVMDGMLSIEKATEFIKYYCGTAFNDKQLFHYLAYVAIDAYYWFVWALYREACGAVMGESLHNWYKMAKDYSKYLVKTYNL